MSDNVIDCVPSRIMSKKEKMKSPDKPVQRQVPLHVKHKKLSWLFINYG